MQEAGWDATLATGDALVDQQHRDIHELVDYVRAAEDRPTEVLRVLDRLMEHVDCHFTTEEELMARSGYTGDAAARHIEEHRALTQAAREQVLLFRSGELTSTAPLAGFLREWLAGHVHGYDRAFVEFVRERSLAAELPERWAERPPG